MKAQSSLAALRRRFRRFFPFPDECEEAAKAGATAVIQQEAPSAMRRDRHPHRLGLAMAFTGMRHFLH